MPHTTQVIETTSFRSRNGLWLLRRLAEIVGWGVIALFVAGLFVGDFRMFYAAEVRCSVNGGAAR